MLFDDGIHLITAVRRNMKEKALSNKEKLLLRKRSVAGFLLNLISALAAYSFFPKKPSIKKEMQKKQTPP